MMYLEKRAAVNVKQKTGIFKMFGIKRSQFDPDDPNYKGSVTEDQGQDSHSDDDDDKGRIEEPVLLAKKQPSRSVSNALPIDLSRAITQAQKPRSDTTRHPAESKHAEPAPAPRPLPAGPLSRTMSCPTKPLPVFNKVLPKMPPPRSEVKNEQTKPDIQPKPTVPRPSKPLDSEDLGKPMSEEPTKQTETTKPVEPDPCRTSAQTRTAGPAPTAATPKPDMSPGEELRNVSSPSKLPPAPPRSSKTKNAVRDDSPSHQNSSEMYDTQPDVISDRRSRRYSVGTKRGERPMMVRMTCV